MQNMPPTVLGVPWREPIVSQEQGLQSQEGKKGSKDKLTEIISENPGFRYLSLDDIEELGGGLFCHNNCKSSAVLYVNCNVLLVGRHDSSIDSTAISSYTFDRRGVVTPLHTTNMGDFNVPHRESGKIAADIFEYLMEITEGRGFEQCGLVRAGPNGELYISLNGFDLALPYSYSGMSVRQMFPYEEKILRAMYLLTSLIKKAPRALDKERTLHAAIVAVGGNQESFFEEYNSPDKSWIV